MRLSDVDASVALVCVRAIVCFGRGGIDMVKSKDVFKSGCYTAFESEPDRYTRAFAAAADVCEPCQMYGLHNGLLAGRPLNDGALAGRA